MGGSTRVGEVLEETDERLGRRPEPDILTLTEKNGFVSQQERFTKRLAVEDTRNYKVVRRFDIAFNPYLLWAGALAQNLHWEEGIVSPLYPTFRVRPGYDPRFVDRLLRSPGMIARYDSIAFGSVPRRRRTSVADFLDLTIPVPPSILEQQRVAEILDKADGIRAKCRSGLAALDSLTHSIFIDMFGNSATGATSWPLRALGDLVLEFRYGTSTKSAEHGKPALRIPNIVAGTVDMTDLKMVPVSDSEFKRLRLRDGDLLFVRTNGNPDSVGRCAVFDSLSAASSGSAGDQFVFASYLIRARLADVIEPVFLREYLLGPEGRRQLRSRCKTSAGQFNVNTESLSTISVPFPPSELQVEFKRRVTMTENMKTLNRSLLADLDSLFTSLQHDAFQIEH